jgi:3-methyladenine DNA glycosylase AlkD
VTTSTSGYAKRAVADIRDALTPLADPARAEPMRAYMKNIAPYLGIGTPERRGALRPLFKAWSEPSQEELGDVARLLWAQPEREYHYAACDVIAKYQIVVDATFLHDHVEFLLTTKPWWDTVDALGTAIVTPLVARNQPLVDTMWTWIRGDNMWLTRAAIQHQRGLKQDTDVPRLVAMCDARSADREFFLAKAVGWALRDLAHIDVVAATTFLADHPSLPPVAKREAVRGLTAVGALP